MDKNTVQHIQETVKSGVQAIDKSELIGKFKIWFLWFMLILRLLWPMLLYGIRICTVEVIAKINKAMRKWLGLLPYLSDIMLYCRKAKLVLLFHSVVGGKLKLEKPHS